MLSHTNKASIRGSVVRDLPHSLLVATGGGVITIHQPTRTAAAATDHGVLRPGTIGEFRVRFDTHPWLDVDRDCWLVIHPTRITGRRVGPQQLEWAFSASAYL